MPFYDLRCPSCNKEYNISASIAEKTGKRVPCPDCGSFNLETVYKSGVLTSYKPMSMNPAYIKNIQRNDCPNRHSCGAACSYG